MDKTICVELDGVLAMNEGKQSMEHIGEPHPEAKRFLQEIGKMGSIVIFSRRCCDTPNGGYHLDEQVEIVEDWLRKHDLPYDYVYSGRGKIVADAYVDDRSVFCDINSCFPSYEQVIQEVRNLCSSWSLKAPL